MGQQQLLLIVLSAIIVGIAIMVAINLFNSHSVTANQNAVIGELIHLGSSAQQYYHKPLDIGGGGRSFIGWSIPSSLISTGTGTYSISSISSLNVIILGTGKEKGNDDNFITVTATISPNEITNSVTD